MSKESDSSEAPGLEPQPWWCSKPRQIVIKSWKTAVTKYLTHHGRKIQHEKLDEQFIKKVIPFVHFEDKDWKDFPLELFEPKTYQAHLAMQTAIEEEHQNLLTNYNNAKALKAADKAKAKANQEKAERDALHKFTDSIAKGKEPRSSAKNSSQQSEN